MAELPEGVERWRADGFRMVRVEPSFRSRHPDAYIRVSDLPKIEAAVEARVRERIREALRPVLAHFESESRAGQGLAKDYAAGSGQRVRYETEAGTYGYAVAQITDALASLDQESPDA